MSGKNISPGKEAWHCSGTGPGGCPFGRGVSHEQERFGSIKIPDGNEPLARATASLGEGKQRIIGHKRGQSPGCGSRWAKVLELGSAEHLKAFYLVCDSHKPDMEATDTFNTVSLQLERKK